MDESVVYNMDCMEAIGDTGGYDIAWLAYRRRPDEAAT